MPLKPDTSNRRIKAGVWYKDKEGYCTIMIEGICEADAHAFIASAVDRKRHSARLGTLCRHILKAIQAPYKRST